MNTAVQEVRQVAFEDLALTVLEQNGEEWFTAQDIGQALGLEEPRIAAMKIFNRHRDEFEGLHRVTKLVTWLKSGQKIPHRLTVFNPQGAYLLAILARTPKSKALRRWLAKFMAQDLTRFREGVQQLQAHNREIQDSLTWHKAKLSQLEGKTRQLDKSKDGLQDLTAQHQKDLAPHRRPGKASPKSPERPYFRSTGHYLPAASRMAWWSGGVFGELLPQRLP